MTGFNRIPSRRIGSLKRINVGYIYRLYERLHPMTTWVGQKSIVEMFNDVFSFRTVLEELFNYGNFYGLKTCGPAAGRLYGLLEQYANPPPERLAEKVTAIEIQIIAQAAQAFEIALIEEFGTLPCYLVTPKGGYSLDVLTTSPELLFSEDLLRLVPEAKYDVEQAAKCLAYEVPTAAGFHLHRINEAVLRVYWDIVTNNAKRPKERSMGVYLAQLRKKNKGDAKILANLQQIKDLDRNPISHPGDEPLSVEDAIDLNGIIRSSVSRMLSVIRKSKTADSSNPPSPLQDDVAEKVADALIAEAAKAAKTLRRA